jgi:excisionase family DNA binding protein
MNATRNRQSVRYEVPNEGRQPIINYTIPAEELNMLLEQAEARGEQRGYERAKREEEPPINAKEAAKFLQVHLSTIKRWTSDGTIKHHKKGGNTYYYKSEIKP